MKTEEERLRDLFAPFKPDLKGLGIDLAGFDYNKAVLLTPESLRDATSNGDPAVGQYISKLAEAVKAHKENPHVTAKKFLNGNQWLQLPDKSIDVVVNLGLHFWLTSSLQGEYPTLRHRIKESAMGEAYRILRHGGLYLVIDELPHLSYTLYPFEDRFSRSHDSSYTTLFIR